MRSLHLRVFFTRRRFRHRGVPLDAHPVTPDEPLGVFGEKLSLYHPRADDVF